MKLPNHSQGRRAQKFALSLAVCIVVLPSSPASANICSIPDRIIRAVAELKHHRRILTTKERLSYRVDAFEYGIKAVEKILSAVEQKLANPNPYPFLDLRAVLADQIPGKAFLAARLMPNGRYSGFRTEGRARRAINLDSLPNGHEGRVFTRGGGTFVEVSYDSGPTPTVNMIKDVFAVDVSSANSTEPSANRQLFMVFKNKEVFDDVVDGLAIQMSGNFYSQLGLVTNGRIAANVMAELGFGDPPQGTPDALRVANLFQAFLFSTGRKDFVGDSIGLFPTDLRADGKLVIRGRMPGSNLDGINSFVKGHLDQNLKWVRWKREGEPVVVEGAIQEVIGSSARTSATEFTIVLDAP